MRAFYWICLALVIIGGVNWGLVGAFGFDLVAEIFGPMTYASRFVYTAVGLAAVSLLFLALSDRSYRSHTVATA